MQKKTFLLSTLKRQVLALKTHLEKLQKTKHCKCKQSYQSRANRSVSHSLRFDSPSYDRSDLDRGIRKFHADKFKNIAQLIQEKSVIAKTPRFSSQRKNQYDQTRSNFSSQKPQQSKSRSRSPNPLTGQGYKQRGRGLRTSYGQREERAMKRSQRKHFNINC